MVSGGRAYSTVKNRRATARSPLGVPQLTSTGHEPGIVLVGTVQDQETSPAPSAALASRPCAVVGPEECVTVMVQSAYGTVLAVAIAT